MATHWTASAVTFTAGQKTATVNTGDDIGSIFPNSALFVGGFDTPFEVSKAFNDGGTQKLELTKNWSGTSGQRSCIIIPSAAAAAQAGKSAQELNSSIASLVNAASTTPASNSFVLRDSGGRVKTSTASAANDAVPFGQLGDSAFLESYKGYGISDDSVTSKTDTQNINSSGIFQFGSSAANLPVSGFSGPLLSLSFNDDANALLALNRTGSRSAYFTSASGGSWDGWKEFYHSSNVNFDTFGGSVNDSISIAVGISSTTVTTFLTINKVSPPISINVSGSWSVNEVSGGASRGTVSGGDITLTGQASSRAARVNITGLSGITVGEVYDVRCVDANSVITVN